MPDCLALTLQRCRHNVWSGEEKKCRISGVDNIVWETSSIFMVSVLQLCEGCFDFQLVEYIIKIIIYFYGQVIITGDGYTSMMMMMMMRRMRMRMRSRRRRRRSTRRRSMSRGGVGGVVGGGGGGGLRGE